MVAERNYYARHQAYMDRIAKRAEPYLYYIVEEVEKRKMPMEIALLPIVESAFDPTVILPQCQWYLAVYATNGQTLWLKKNWWYDGRRDIAESTRAALDYLSDVFKTFSDWLNAIAAYNSGRASHERSRKSP